MGAQGYDSVLGSPIYCNGSTWTPTSNAVIGSVRNAKMYVSAAGATATFTADEIVVGTSNTGSSRVLSSYSQSINSGTTGAGGMDTGSAPASGYVSLYAITEANGTTSILACNASTSTTTVYSGSNMPSGYVASALIGIWPTNSSSQFIVGLIMDRSFSRSPVEILSGGTASSYTSVSISSVVPPGAKTVSGWLGFTSVSGGDSFFLASDANGTGAVFAYTGGSATNYPFSGLPIITSQTLYYYISAGSAQFAINGYTF